MKTSTRLGMSLCAALVAFAATSCSSTKSATPVNAAEMQAKFTAYATPSAGHKALEQKIGKWKLAVTMFMAPGTPPIQSTGTSEVKWILDGRYVEDVTEGEAMGQPFHGKGLVGYDNLKKKYVSTWIDTMSTGVMTGEGAYDAAKKTWTYTTSIPDVMAGEYTKGRSIERFVDNDHWVMQSFTPDPNGDEFLSMEIHYTR